MGVLEEYLDYHRKSSAAKDIDTANDCLQYICERFELNTEQRYWLAFLYASTYSAATAFYIYNEFPDYEHVNVARLQRWWDANKEKTIFQTDRRWIKSRNQFVDSFISYQKFIGKGMTQKQRFMLLQTGEASKTYEECMAACSQIFTFGRFTLFLYLEMIHTLTGYKLQPNTLDLQNAESSRNGLCYAIGRDDLMNHFTEKKLTKKDITYLNGELQNIIEQVKKEGLAHQSIWSIETTLCAFKKHKLGKRWIGYYIERQQKEILHISSLVTQGVDWDVLWQFRQETYEQTYTNSDSLRRRTSNRQDNGNERSSFELSEPEEF